LIAIILSGKPVLIFHILIKKLHR